VGELRRPGGPRARSPVVMPTMAEMAMEEATPPRQSSRWRSRNDPERPHQRIGKPVAACSGARSLRDAAPPLDSARTACPAGTVDLEPGRSTMRWEEAPMCPACIATATLVVAGAG